MRRTVLVFCCLVVLTTTALASDLSPGMPLEVGSYMRTRLITGAEAQAAVDKLHGKALLARESVIADYSLGSGRPVEVWVSRVTSEKEARRQTGVMVHKMFENPKSPFSSPSRLDHHGVAVYRFTGMGMAHLIWASRDLVWWVSVPPEDQSLFLDAFCR